MSKLEFGVIPEKPICSFTVYPYPPPYKARLKFQEPEAQRSAHIPQPLSISCSTLLFKVLFLIEIEACAAHVAIFS